MKHQHGDKLMELIAKASGINSLTIQRRIKELIKSGIIDTR